MDRAGPDASGSDRAQIRALDGLRGMAVLMVMLFHIPQKGLVKGGYLGVDVFFVLSGYLITSLLIGERERAGRVRYRAFYARRALRLLPALVAVILAAVLLAQLPAVAPERELTLHGVPDVLFYIGNWPNAFQGVDALGLLSHTWSLAVEEQYYLAWPAILLLALRLWPRTTVAKVLGGLVLVIWVARISMVHSGVLWFHVYFSTLEHCDGLLAGSALALAGPLLRERRLPPSTARYAPPIALLVLLGMSLRGDNTFTIQWTLFMPVAVVCTGVVVHFAVDGALSPVYRILSSRPAVWIGRRSYGLYLWHIPIYITLYYELPAPAWCIGALGLVTAFAVETVCYDRIESPALRLKERYPGASLEPAPAKL